MAASLSMTHELFHGPGQLQRLVVPVVWKNRVVRRVREF